MTLEAFGRIPLGLQQERWAVASEHVDARGGHSEPGPNQLANGEDYDTSDEEQKDRHGQIALLLEFLKAFINPRRSSKEH